MWEELFMGWGPGLNKREKMTRTPTFIALCFLLEPNTAPTSGSTVRPCPPWWTPANHEPYQPFLKFFLSYIVTAVREVTDTVLTFRKMSTFVFTSFLLLCFSYDVRWLIKGQRALAKWQWPVQVWTALIPGSLSVFCVFSSPLLSCEASFFGFVRVNAWNFITAKKCSMKKDRPLHSWCSQWSVLIIITVA